MKLKEALREYATYSGAVFTRAALTYYIALVTAPAEFVIYNAYIFYSDIFSMIVSSGTLAAFSTHGTSEKRLRAALFFETTLLLVLLFFYWLKSLIFPRDISVRLSLLFLLAFFRTINLLFSRYYLSFRSITLSNLNDLLGNFLWIGILCVFLSFGFHLDVEHYMQLWILILFICCVFNIISTRAILIRPRLVHELKEHWHLYLKSFHFTLLYKLFGSVEKILMIHKFGTSLAASSYLMSSKVTGLVAEMSGGFAQSIAFNRVGKFQDPVKKEKKYLNLFLCFISVAMVLTCIAVFLGSDLLYFLLKTQVTQDNMSLFYWLIPLSAFTQMHGIFMVYLQKRHQFAFLLFSTIYLLGVLAVLYYLHASIYQFVAIQTFAFFILFVADMVTYHLKRSP